MTGAPDRLSRHGGGAGCSHWLGALTLLLRLNAPIRGRYTALTISSAHNRIYREGPAEAYLLGGLS
ncbi:hypothetical protein D3C85_1120390 [compost metagenome]